MPLGKKDPSAVDASSMVSANTRVDSFLTVNKDTGCELVLQVGSKLRA